MIGSSCIWVSGLIRTRRGTGVVQDDIITWRVTLICMIEAKIVFDCSMNNLTVDLTRWFGVRENRGGGGGSGVRGRGMTTTTATATKKVTVGATRISTTL